MSAKPQAILVPHTHWDREWRYPLWKNRQLLVQFMDELLHTLETKPEFASFVMDGQVAPITDYLEVRPEARERVIAQVKAGRLKIGPWYTLPDLYPLDGECLVRNLVVGWRISESLGGAMRFGYNSFGWGQTAQFPQIYAGFGFDFIIAAKKVSAQRAPHCEYLWESPDGTQVFSSRLGQHGRANFFVNAYVDIRHDVEYHAPEYVFRWDRAGVVYHEADAAVAYKDWFSLSTNAGYHPQQIPVAAERAWKAMDETLLPQVRLIMSGCDFTAPQSILGRIVADANRLLSDRDWRHGTVEEYIAALKAGIPREKLPLVKGELRDGAAPDNSGNALATRIYLKLLNKQVENALIRRAEPLAAALAMQGAEYPRGFTRLAWKHLLESHPHDSINGVTQDKTADDVYSRLQNAQEIAEVVAEQAIADLIRRLDLSAYGKDDLLLLVVNPRPHAAREVLPVAIDTPQELNAWDLTATDHAGRPLRVQAGARQAFCKPVNDLESRPWPFYLDRHQVWIETGEIPAGGWTVIRLAKNRSFNHKAEFWAPTKLTTYDEIGRAGSVLENEHLRVEAAADGTLTLTDKAAGVSHAGLHWFEDTGEVGDYWVSYPPYHNRTFTSKAATARIWLEANGPLAATLAVEVTMQVPAHGEKPLAGIHGESRRSDHTVPLVITSRFTLRAGSRRLDVRTACLNTARDHRLRVALPTGIQAQSAAAAGHFTVDERPLIPMRERPDGWYDERRTNPMHWFVDVSDGSRGFGVVSDSLTEYELATTADRTLFLTLFRSVRNSICTEFRSGGNFPDQHGGQCLREMSWEYGIVLHAGGWQAGGLVAEAEAFNTRPAAYQITPHARGTLPAHGSLFALEGDQLVLAAFKAAEDRATTIVRIWNPTDAPIAGRLVLRTPAKRAWRTNLNEQREADLPVTGGGVAVTVKGKQIVTIEVEVDPPRTA